MSTDVSRACEVSESALIRLDRLVQTGRFVSSFAHEINNCLQVIAGLAELAIDEPAMPAAVRSKLERIMGQAARGSGSVRALLAFARERTAAVETTDLASLAEGVLALRQYPLGRMRAEVQFERSADERCRVVGSPLQLEQLILALVLNAERALTTADGPKRLDVVCRVDDQRVRLEVSDNGRGIDAAVQPSMFEPFVSGGGDESPGIGLAAARAIATLHGGEVTAEPRPDGGTTMVVTLPRAQ